MERYGNGDRFAAYGFRPGWSDRYGAPCRIVLGRDELHRLGHEEHHDQHSRRPLSLDAIARITDTCANVFQVNFDVGYAARTLDGDGGLDTTFLRGTLEARRRVFHGPIAAAGISLRQVQAIAELPYFLQSKTESLEGLQPVFRFSFEAPMIRF